MRFTTLLVLVALAASAHGARTMLRHSSRAKVLQAMETERAEAHASLLEVESRVQMEHPVNEIVDYLQSLHSNLEDEIQRGEEKRKQNEEFCADQDAKLESAQRELTGLLAEAKDDVVKREAVLHASEAEVAQTKENLERIKSALDKRAKNLASDLLDAKHAEEDAASRLQEALSVVEKLETLSAKIVSFFHISEATEVPTALLAIAETVTSKETKVGLMRQAISIGETVGRALMGEEGEDGKQLNLSALHSLLLRLIGETRQQIKALRSAKEQAVVHQTRIRDAYNTELAGLTTRMQGLQEKTDQLEAVVAQRSHLAEAARTHRDSLTARLDAANALRKETASRCADEAELHDHMARTRAEDHDAVRQLMSIIQDSMPQVKAVYDMTGTAGATGATGVSGSASSAFGVAFAA